MQNFKISDSNKKAIAETALKYCKRNWQTEEGRDKGLSFNSQVTKFFTVAVEYAEDPLAIMQDIFDNGVQDVFENRTKEYANETYQTITRGSLGCVYQVCLSKLALIVKKETIPTTSTN